MKKMSQKKVRKLMDTHAQGIVAGMFEHIRTQPFLTRLRVAVRILFRRGA